MLVELSVMEQRYQAVMAVVQDGWKVTEVAERLGVTRRRSTTGSPAMKPADCRPSPIVAPPHSCAHQIPPELEALICEIRGSIRVGDHGASCMSSAQGIDPLPVDRASIAVSSVTTSSSSGAEEEARRVPPLGA